MSLKDGKSVSDDNPSRSSSSAIHAVFPDCAAPLKSTPMTVRIPPSTIRRNRAREGFVALTNLDSRVKMMKLLRQHTLLAKPR